ncbi:unnamed protein product [Cladocopium goreaui]|uniref:Uncharacterized protein n=1 Tax=Cladocopium goreaui TaxID=2562237 RepID=A0A9P1C796_9DINO|nr:unnamed protein product [Cladocopium goreaui]
MGHGLSTAEICTCWTVRNGHSASRQVSKEKGRWRPTLPHLVLHFDVNKTVVMVDTIQGIPTSDVLNGILAECAWGRAKPNGHGPPEKGWQLVEQMPSSVRPTQQPELMSYLEYLEQSLPGKAKEMKKKREQVWKKFTEPGEPGELLRPHYENMAAQLQMQGRMVGTGMVIAAFFDLVADLVKNGRSFSIVFRTFGSDLPAVQAEFNAFCAGEHPRYPDLCLDGSAEGKPDLRLTKENTGSWYRSADNCSIVWGTTTLEEDLHATKGVLDDFLKLPGNTGLLSSRGWDAVIKDLQTKTSKPSVLALRDYFPYWQKGGQHGPYGKLLPVDPADHRCHPIFFDDNITLDAEDTKIVDVRDKTGKALWPLYAQRYYISRAEPLLAVADDNYYIRKVEEIEHNFQRKRLARLRLRAATLTVSKMLREEAEAQKFDLPKRSGGYDPWAKSRVSISKIHFSSSIAAADEEEHALMVK